MPWATGAATFSNAGCTIPSTIPRGGGPNAVNNAIGYAEHRSRSHDAVIRVYDAARNVIETHEHTGDVIDSLLHVGRHYLVGEFFEKRVAAQWSEEWVNPDKGKVRPITILNLPVTICIFFRFFCRDKSRFLYN